MNLGASEIFLVVLIVLLLFGGRRLPELARRIGKGLAEFRRATQQIQHEINQPLSESTIDRAVPLKSLPNDYEKTTIPAHVTTQPRPSAKPPGPAS